MSGTISNNVHGFTEIVSQECAAAQVSVATAKPGTVLTFTPGSVLLAIFQAVAGVVLWLQAFALNLLLFGRASTSVGPDLDSWMAQFHFTRIAGVQAICNTVQLSRYSTSSLVSILPGGIVQPTDGSQPFTIIAPPPGVVQSAWTPLGFYQMNPTVGTIQVSAQAVNVGVGGNVGANVLTSFGSGIRGVDTVNNTGAATGGQVPETDAAFLARFWLYLQYLFRATGAAVTYAIQSIQSGLTVTITDGYDTMGDLAPGTFFATVDDGSGSPPAALISAAAQQAYLTRALGIQSAAYGPSVVVATIVATIKTSYPTSDGPAANAAAAALIATITLGQSLSYFRLGAAIAAASPTIVELAGLTINGVQADLTATVTQKIEAGTITVNTESP